MLSGAQQFGILVDLLEERMSAATSAKTLFLMALALASSGRTMGRGGGRGVTTGVQGGDIRWNSAGNYHRVGWNIVVV